MRFEQMAFATYLQENANLVLAWRKKKGKKRQMPGGDGHV